MQPYLIPRSGPGWAHDEFIASAASGRYVAVRQGACLELVDARAGTATRLPDADLDDGLGWGAHRAAAFDSIGKHMLYVRGGTPQHIVARDLVTGAEKTLATRLGWTHEHNRGHYTVGNGRYVWAFGSTLIDLEGHRIVQSSPRASLS